MLSFSFFTVLSDRLSDLEIKEITKSPEATRNYIKLLNETFPSSPYLRRQLRKRDRSEAGNESDSAFFPMPLRRSNRARHSVSSTTDRSSTSSSECDKQSTSSNLSTSTSDSSNKLSKKYICPKANKNDEYKVEAIVKFDIIQSRPYFYVKWHGWPPYYNTWEPLEHVRDTDQFVPFIEQQRQDKEIVQVMLELETELLSDVPLELPTTKTDMDAILKSVSKLDDVLLDVDMILLAQVKLFDKARYPKRMLAEVKKMLPVKRYKEMRIAQMQKIEAWNRMINEKEVDSKIHVENLNDFDTPPENFVYIKNNIAGQDVEFNEEPTIFCECKDQCSYGSDCCAKRAGYRFAYNCKRSIRIPKGFPIYECNKRCKCGPECPNRVIQQGRKHKLVIFKTFNGRGWGVRTESVIPDGQFICEYTGEVITSAEAERRGEEYDSVGRTYLFDLDFNTNDNPYTIDALNYGNISRFINHSCKPNIGIWAAWINDSDPNMQKIVFFSTRRIEAGEELSIDYLNQPDQYLVQTVRRTNEISVNSNDNTQFITPNENLSPNCTPVKCPPLSPQKVGTPKKGFRMSQTSLFNSDAGGQPKFDCKCGEETCRKFIFY